LKLVIDASNIFSGGGLTHLKEFISHIKPEGFNIEQIILWAPSLTLEQVVERHFLIKQNHPLLNKSYIHRYLWKYLVLKRALTKDCILYIPGGGYLESEAKVITMCRNLLPIDKKEMNRFFPSLRWLRYRLLRIILFSSYKKANGVIFLNKYCINALPKKVMKNIYSYSIIPHGLNNEFKKNRKTSYSVNGLFHFAYLSRINLYKHQWNVAKAIYELKGEGYPVRLTLAGGMQGPGSKMLQNVIRHYVDQFPDTVQINELIHYTDLPNFYKEADAFIFASSCETFGNILLEAMGVGLPIACSELSSMRELLDDAGVYFNPENVASIKKVLRILVSDEHLRSDLGNKAAELSQNYSWEKTCEKTLQYISLVSKQ
jgi:glycosyltransferase involved in cell wall biosynthesis